MYVRTYLCPVERKKNSSHINWERSMMLPQFCSCLVERNLQASPSQASLEPSLIMTCRLPCPVAYAGLYVRKNTDQVWVGPLGGGRWCWG